MFIFKKKSQLNFSWFKNLRQSLLSIHWYVSKIDRKRSSTLHTFGLHLAPRDRRHLRRYGISSTALCSQALLSDFLRPVFRPAQWKTTQPKRPISWDFFPRCQYPRASRIRWYSSRLEALDYESSGFFRSHDADHCGASKKNKKHDHHFLWNHFFGHLMLLSKTQLFDNSFNSRFQKYHMCCCNSRWQRFHLQHHTWHRFSTSVEVPTESLAAFLPGLGTDLVVVQVPLDVEQGWRLPNVPWFWHGRKKKTNIITTPCGVVDFYKNVHDIG